MIYNLNKNKSNPVENYHRKLAERKYARDKSLKTRDEEINAESDYIQNTPEFESYTPAYDVNQNITQNVAEKTEEETNKGGFWGGLGYAIEQLGLGLVRSLEGISDYVVGGVAELFGQDEWADEQMRNDWINYDHANEWYNPDGVMQFVGDVASGVGGMLPSIGAAAIPGIGPALSTGMFMTSAAGQSVSDAAKQNEGLSGNEWLYGTGSGLVEGLVEKISGGTGKLLGKATGKMFGKQIAKSTAGKLAANFVGEGLEEVASDIIDPALRGITGVNSWEEVKRQYGDLPEQLPHTFLVGGTVGSVLGSADRAGRAIQAKGFNNLNAIENASEFKRVEGQNAQAAVKGGKVLDNTALREKLSDNLRKMDSAQRSEFISRNGLENYFNADGGIKSASENSIVSQGYNAQAYSENIANIDKDKLKYKPTANAIRPDIAQAVKDVTLLSDGNGRYVITDGLSDGVNGFYDRESGITYLSGKADAGDVRSYVASHELVHTLEGSRQYERFANTVLKEINSSEALKNKYNIDRYIQNYSAAHDGVAPETLQYIVQTEIVADFAAKEMLTDEAVLRRLINRDRNIVQRILDWVRDKIKILVSKGGDRSNIAFYKKAERQLAKALDNPTGGVSITAMDNAFKAKETSRKTAAENTLAVETGIRFSQKISEYPYSMQTVISEYIESVDKKILDMVEVPKSIFERYTFSEISPEAVVKLKELTGIDFTGYKNCINSDSIKHIKDRHGKAGKADDSLSNSKDIARLPYIVENFDTIELLKNRDGKLLYSSLFYNRYNKKMPLVVFKKKINGTYYCVEAVGDNSYKKLWVVSAYINKKGLTHASDTANAAPEFTSENAHISRPFDSIIRERAEKSTEKSKNIEKNSETKSNEVGEEARYSIVNINAGRKAVLIKDNILDGVSKKDRLKTVYDTMKKFSNGIPIAGGRLIKVNAITRNEYINSKNAQYLKGNITKNTIFIDKMKASGHLDEIVLASDSYVNEGLKHTRNDNIKEFARGNVLLDIAGNQYAANVIVGFTGSNMILYDVVDFKPTKFTVTEQNGKKIDAAEGANPFERATPSTTSIREKTEKSTEKSKNIEKNSELRYSLKPFAEQVDDVLAGKRSANLDLYVSETPDVFVKLGFPKTPMLMRNSKVKEILEKHMEMSVELIKQIPEAIQNPLFILKSKTNPNESVVAITEIVTDKGELIVPVWVNQDGVYLDIDLDKPVTVKTNFVASAYGRNVKGLLEYAADNGGILYVNSNKEKVGELLTRHGLQLPAPLRITDSTTSIRENTEKSTEKSKNIEKSIVKEKNAGEERFSIAQTDDGKRIVVIDTDQDIFDGVERSDMGKIVRSYMKERYRGRSINGTAFTAQSEREFTHSRDSQRLYNKNNGTYEAKMRVSTELSNIIQTGDLIDHETAKHPQTINEGGIKRYNVSFVLDGKTFNGEMIIAVDKKGVETFYDVIKIKESESSNNAPDGTVRTNAHSINIISNNSENVNSLREKGGDVRNSLKNEITTYGNGMSVTQKPGKYSEVLTKVKIDKLSYGEMAKDTWTNFQINFSDAQTGIVKAGKKLGIEDIDAKTNYVRAAYNAANSMLDENQADISGKRVGDGLKKIFSPVYKKGEEYVKEFYTYLLLKHHADRIKVDKTVLGDLTAAEALQLAVQREIKYPEFKTLAAKVWKYNDNLLQYRVDTGLITAEAAAACRKLYPHYVPTFREGGSSGIGGLSGKYNLAVKSTLKTAKGSTLDIMPIDVIMARQTMEVVRAGRINQLKNSLYDALESRQNYSDMRVAGVERVNKVTEKLRLTAPVKAELYNTLDVDYSTMRDMNNQISFYKDGNRITLDVTPEVFAGFEDFAPNTVYRDKLIEVVAKGNTMFKKLVTSANPFFLVRNFFRDLQDSLFYTKHGIRRFLPSLAKAYKQIATKGEMWNEYLAAGGLSSGLFDYNTGIKRDGTGLKSLAERALNKLEYANMFIEQAPRLAEYMLSRQKGLSVEQSLLDSADVTTNFGRGGKTAKMLNRTVMPFLNPSIQGWSKLVRTVFGKKNVSQWIQLIVRSLLLGIGLTALNDLLNGDDEDYKAVSLRDKENYYLFNIGDGQFLKLPKGRVLSVLGSLYLRGKESAKGNANAWDGYLESAASAVSPVDNFTRTIFSPLTDAATNTTWYGGVIEGRGLQNLSPENRYDESTSEIAKALGKALNYSPKKIHYIIDQYAGVIGDIVLPMTTAKSERGLIASNFTVNTAVSNRYSGEFYDKLDEITYAKNDGDRNAAFKYRYLNDIAGEVSDMYAKRREIENSDLSQQDKSAQSEAVSVLISQTQKSAVKGLDVLDEILNSIDYDKRVAKLTQGFAYRQLTDDEKEKAAVKMYDYYYALAMNKAFGAELDRKQTICNMINDDRIFIYLAHISSLTADTDSNGNTINGSRKKKVETYVDGLPLSSLHKYLLMLLAGYKLGDIGKNKVAGYFNEAALDNSIRENLLSFVA